MRYLLLFLAFCALAFGDELPETGVYPVSEEYFEQQLSQTIHYGTENNFVGYLYIGPGHRIDHTTYVQIKLALDEYKKKRVIFVLCRLNTPGGDVQSSRKIAELFEQFDTETHIPIVGVIYNWALSSGAMIAYSCRYLVCTQNALMGSRVPQIPGAQAEKFTPALKQEYATVADYYQRNPLIAQAMIDPALILVKRQGGIVQLNSDSEIHPGEQAITTQGKLLTLDSQQLIDLGIANAIMPIHATRKVLNVEQKLGQWPAVQSQLFHLPFFSKIPNAQILFYNSWKVGLLSFLTNPVLCSIFLFGLVVCASMQKKSWSILSVICFALVVIPHGILGEIGATEYVLYAIGFALLLFMKKAPWPILGSICILAAIFGTLLPSPSALMWNLAMIEFVERLCLYIGVFILALIVVAVIFHARKLRALRSQPHEKKPNPSTNAEGEAYTSLKPNGIARIGAHLYDALTMGEEIEMGEKIVVKEIRDSILIVARKS